MLLTVNSCVSISSKINWYQFSILEWSKPFFKHKSEKLSINFSILKISKLKKIYYINYIFFYWWRMSNVLTANALFITRSKFMIMSHFYAFFRPASKLRIFLRFKKNCSAFAPKYKTNETRPIVFQRSLWVEITLFAGSPIKFATCASLPRTVSI